MSRCSLIHASTHFLKERVVVVLKKLLSITLISTLLCFNVLGSTTYNLKNIKNTFIDNNGTTQYVIDELGSVKVKGTSAVGIKEKQVITTDGWQTVLENSSGDILDNVSEIIGASNTSRYYALIGTRQVWDLYNMVKSATCKFDIARLFITDTGVVVTDKTGYSVGYLITNTWFYYTIPSYADIDSIPVNLIKSVGGELIYLTSDGKLYVYSRSGASTLIDYNVSQFGVCDKFILYKQNSGDVIAYNGTIKKVIDLKGLDINDIISSHGDNGCLITTNKGNRYLDFLYNLKVIHDDKGLVPIAGKSKHILFNDGNLYTMTSGANNDVYLKIDQDMSDKYGLVTLIKNNNASLSVGIPKDTIFKKEGAISIPIKVEGSVKPTTFDIYYVKGSKLSSKQEWISIEKGVECSRILKNNSEGFFEYEYIWTYPDVDLTYINIIVEPKY